MADRYWVGGSGTWSTTSTTNWSATSGGVGGASVPTAADSVFFNQASTYTVTMTGALNCLDITVSAGTVTFATGTSPTLGVRGSMNLIAGTIWSSTGTITFNATTTGNVITTNGVSFTPAIVFNGVGGGWTLGSALSNSGNAINITAGTFNTANYSITSNSFTIGGTLARAVNLGSSTITLAATSLFSCNPVTNLTFNAGTSTINFSGAANIQSAGLTFYNVSFTGTTAGTRTITGSNTFNNLSIRAPITAGVNVVTIDSSQTINGTFSTVSTLGYCRVLISSATTDLCQSLILNGTASISDCDFKDIIVQSTSGPITGTRLGDFTGCSGINFSAPKTVYWSNTAGGAWYSDSWASTDGGVPDHSNFPLPQDIALITNTVSTSATITLHTMVGNINASARTSPLTFSLSTSATNTDVYGDLILGAPTGIAFNSRALNFCGEKTQVLSPAGQTLSGDLLVNSIRGSLELAGALTIAAGYSISVQNGTFDTKNYTVTVDSIRSNYSSLRTIKLGSSTVTLRNNPYFDFTTNTNLTFDAGTSTVNATGGTSPNFTLASGVAFYNVNFTNTNSVDILIGSNTIFNNLSIPTSTSLLRYVSFAGNTTINGTLTAVGGAFGSPTNESRIFLYSSTLNSPVNLTVNVLNASKCDFRDITLLGNAVNTSVPFAGDLGGNTGIVFPAPKTVYWNLAGAVNWSRAGWASVSGGTPNANNFPLAQDTAVFDNNSTVTGTITINAAWNIGNFDASARTSSMTISLGTASPNIYGNWSLGVITSITTTSGQLLFVNQGTKTITCNGGEFSCNVVIQCNTGTVQLADALRLTSIRRLTLVSGTFDAVSYNVTIGAFSAETAGATLKMGSGTWTLSGTGTTVWYISNTLVNLYKGTADIILSDNTTSARTFGAAGTSYSYNKLTIGGNTSTSTTSIVGNHTFTELASTKTVAHTLNLAATSQTFNKWTITGTAGNVVAISGSGGSGHTLAGPAVSGVDYLGISISLSSASHAEFYAGPNSTGAGSSAPIYLTAKPADRTLYWVGGIGNWSSTSKWSNTSGGAGGQSLPRSHDNVIFDTLSGTSSYQASIDTTARCNSLTISGPSSGSLTLAGAAQLILHQGLTFPATGMIRSYSGSIVLSGSGTGKLFTTNGVILNNTITVNSADCTWALGSALNNSAATVNISSGALELGTYNLTAGSISSATTTSRSLNLGSSSISLSSSTPIDFGTSAPVIDLLNFSAGTSTISCTSASNPIFNGAGEIFYNVSFTSTQNTQFHITGSNTFNNLTLAAVSVVGVRPIYIYANQIINGTLTAGGSSPTTRGFLLSNTFGTQRTLTCNAVSLSDLDIQDIAFAGTAVPVSGVRLGDCKGNTGVDFPAAKTVYWNLANGGNFTNNAWATSIGGAVNAANFPLAQDTAVFASTGLSNLATVGPPTTINSPFNVGTINMSARGTGAAMTFAMGSASLSVYGNWINGTQSGISGSGTIIFAGRASQTITSAGKAFPVGITLNSPSGTLTQLDALTSSSGNTFSLLAGSYDSNNFSTTLSIFSTSGTLPRSVNVGTGVWNITGTGTVWTISSTTGFTFVPAINTINLSGSTAKTFAGGGLAYTGISVNQGGAGALTITGNNTFKDITNSYSVTGASTISLGSTIQTLEQFTGSGTLGKLLTISGTSAAAPANLFLTGSTDTTADYVSVSNVRMYKRNIGNWQFGTSSVNRGSYGAVFAAVIVLYKAFSNFFAFF